jgi:hypothetical protein
VYFTVLQKRGKGPGFDSQQVQFFLAASEATEKVTFKALGDSHLFFGGAFGPPPHRKNTTSKDPMLRLQLLSKSAFISFRSLGM